LSVKIFKVEAACSLECIYRHVRSDYRSNLLLGFDRLRGSRLDLFRLGRSIPSLEADLACWFTLVGDAKPLVNWLIFAEVA